MGEMAIKLVDGRDMQERGREGAVVMYRMRSIHLSQAQGKRHSSGARTLTNSDMASHCGH